MDFNDEKDEKWSFTKKFLGVLKRIVAGFKKIRDKINAFGKNKNDPKLIVAITAGVCALIAIILLFIPPFIGMADDGSYASTINKLGIFSIEDTKENMYFNFYNTKYFLMAPTTRTPEFTSMTIVVSIAKAIDWFFTRDSYFDIRFLTGIYFVLYVPAIALLIKSALYNVRHFSERVVIAVSTVLIFSDVVYIAYFGSFYTEPLIFLLFIYLVCSMIRLRGYVHNFFYLALFTVSAMLLSITKKELAVIGIICGIFAVRYLFINRKTVWKISCCFCALLIFVTSLYSFQRLPNDYNEASKLNSMTHGVMFEAENPEKALEEFGITPNYAVLSGTSTYDKTPVVSASNEDIKKNFLSKYDSASIAYYYLKHPGSMFSMLNMSIKVALDNRRTMSGNFEKSVGLPKMARMPFFAMWSYFKANTIPSTVGFILLLIVGVFFLFKVPKSKLRKNMTKRTTLPRETMIFLLVAGVLEALITIVEGGDSEMLQHIFILSVSIDLIIYFCFAKILHRLNAF